MDKIQFIKTDFSELASTLQPNDMGKWGLMNAQQMIEHVADFFKVSYEKIKFDLVTPEAMLPKYKEFLLSDNEFKENTKAPVLPEKPFDVRHTSIEASVEELKTDINNFFAFFENSNQKLSLHPVFGNLSFDEWVQLHFKHTLHHAKQFGLI